MKVVMATLEDVPEIHNILKRDLVKEEDLKSLTEERRMYLEENGFLRKEVPQSFYSSLIEDGNSAIFVSKDENNSILGFATFYLSKSDVHQFRSSLMNLFSGSEEIKHLLTNPSSHFSYLDQIAVRPEYQRNQIASKIFVEILKSTRLPIIAFVVMKPIQNTASIRWHEKNGFEVIASCDGIYKKEIFEWDIYVHWN